MSTLCFASSNQKIKRFFDQMGRVETLADNALRVIGGGQSGTGTEAGLRNYCDRLRATALGIFAHPSVSYWMFASVARQLPDRNSPTVAYLLKQALRELTKLVIDNCTVEPSGAQMDAIVGQFKQHIMAQDGPYRFDFDRLRGAWREIGFTAVARFADHIALDLNTFRSFYNQFPQVKAELPDTCDMLSFVVGEEGQQMFNAAAASRSK